MTPAFPSRQPDGIEPELNQSVPRRVQLRGAVKFNLLFYLCLSPILLYVTHAPIVALFSGWARPDWLLIVGMLLLGSIGLLLVPSYVFTILVERKLATEGRVVRVQVESCVPHSGMNIGQKIVLAWPATDQPFNAPPRRETVTWNGHSVLESESTKEAIFKSGQIVSVLENSSHPNVFVVYNFCAWQVITPRNLG